jgi:hypothetical protein
VTAARSETIFGLVVAGLLLLLVFAALRRSPKVALVGWLAVVFFVPIWIGVDAVAYFPAFALASILAALSLLPTPLVLRPHVLDLVFVALLVAVLAQVALGLTTRSGGFDVVVVWATAFLLGRLIAEVVDPEWIYGAFAVVGAVAGALAVVEFLTGHNLFIDYLANSSDLFTRWGGLQPRGSVIRAEGAFGHSIALGSRFRPWIKTVLIVVAGLGAAVSFSRAAFLTVILGVLITAFLLPKTKGLSRAYRTLLVLALLVGVAVALGPVRAVFSSDDLAEGSALYRGDLFGLVRSMQPFGLTPDYSVSTTREVSVGEFGSIDNAVLLLGLIYGWVPLLVVGLAAIGAVVTVLRRRATSATIAVVAQLPALFTVAFITQYAAVFWFSAGLALGTQAMLHRGPSSRRPGSSVALSTTPDEQPESAHA